VGSARRQTSKLALDQVEKVNGHLFPQRAYGPRHRRAEKEPRFGVSIILMVVFFDTSDTSHS